METEFQESLEKGKWKTPEKQQSEAKTPSEKKNERNGT
jgi:hypothetical protein